MNLVSFHRARPVMRMSEAPAGVVLRVLQGDEAGLRDLLAREVAAHSGLSGGEVEIVSGSGMKPRVKVGGSPSSDWQVSLSHTQRCCAGVLSLGRAVGVDVEWIDPEFEWEPVAAEFFPLEMAATWNQRRSAGARREFFQHWVRWEAALKCRGTGFGATHCPPANAMLGLSLFDLDLGADHAGCVALASA